jgi:hypothetical protein
MEALHRLRHLTARLDNLVVCLGCGLVPPPGVLECLYLRRRLRAVLLGVEDVVVGVRVEGRIEVDEVDRLILDVAP